MNRSYFYEHQVKAEKLLASQLNGARARQTVNGLLLAGGEITSDQNVINLETYAGNYIYI